MIDTILFDLDNTLLDFNMAEKVALAGALSQLGIEPTEAITQRYSVINLAQWKLLEQGKLTRNEVKLRRFKLLFDELGVNYVPEEAAKLYESLLGVGHYFVDGAEELVQDLSQKYDLYLVTNGSVSIQNGRLKSAGIVKYFKGIFVSEEIGFNKPSKEYFEICFERMQKVNRENVIIIGDSMTSDIQGGINAGIRTVWFNPSYEENDTQIKSDYEIHKLVEFKELAKRI